MDNLNEKEVTRNTLIKELKKILKKKTVANAGGILYKAHMTEKSIAIGIVPYFWYGERKYHYDIHLPEENEYTLFGTLTTEGVLSVYFKMNDITNEKRGEIKKRYSRFATLLTRTQTNLPLELDPLTLQLLYTQKIYPETAKILEDLIQE